MRGPSSPALAKRPQQGYLCPGAHSQQRVLSGSPPPQHFLEQRQGPEAVWVTGKSWSKTCGRQQGANCKHEDKNEHGNTEVNEHEIHLEAVNVLQSPLSPRAEGAAVVSREACLWGEYYSWNPSTKEASADFSSF